jgi:hypothetical protein
MTFTLFSSSKTKVNFGPSLIAGLATLETQLSSKIPVSQYLVASLLELQVRVNHHHTAWVATMWPLYLQLSGYHIKENDCSFHGIRPIVTVAPVDLKCIFSNFRLAQSDITTYFTSAVSTLSVTSYFD